MPYLGKVQKRADHCRAGKATGRRSLRCTGVTRKQRDLLLLEERVHSPKVTEAKRLLDDARLT